MTIHPLDPSDTLDTHDRAINQRILECITSLQEQRPAKNNELDGAIVQEIARLDARLDILMELVGRILMPDADAPPAIPVRFNAYGLSSPSLPDLPAGTPVRTRIHFDHCRALPLQLDGELGEAGSHRFVAFTGIDESLRDGLERLVFRHHRRRVAKTRQPHSPA